MHFNPFGTNVTFLLLVDHTTFLFAASAGDIVVVNSKELPTSIDLEVIFNKTDSTLTTSSGLSSSSTVIIQIAEIFPSSEDTLIVVVPTFNAVTFPY